MHFFMHLGKLYQILKIRFHFFGRMKILIPLGPFRKCTFTYWISSYLEIIISLAITMQHGNMKNHYSKHMMMLECIWVYWTHYLWHAILSVYTSLDILANVMNWEKFWQLEHFVMQQLYLYLVVYCHGQIVRVSLPTLLSGPWMDFLSHADGQL